MTYIPTALSVYDPSNSKSKGEQRRRARYDAKQKLKTIAEDCEIAQTQLLELDSSLITPLDINSALDKANIVYIEGGNTFYLQHHLLRTKFWHYLRHHMANSSHFLYIGASAGAIVAGNSIETAYWKGWDDPTACGSIPADLEWTTERKSGAKLVTDENFFMHYEAALHEDLVRSKSPLVAPNRVKTIKNNVALIYKQEVEDSHRAEGESASGELKFVFDYKIENISKQN